MRTTKNVILLGAAVAFFSVLNVHAYFDPSIGRWASRDPIGEDGGIHLYAFVGNDSINYWDAIGLTKVSKDSKSITQAQAQSGIWGWTDLESSSEKAAKTKLKSCMCIVKKKPEMIFVILVQTANKGKQGWTEDVEFNNVDYQNSSVYVGSALAAFSNQHEGKRYEAWKTALMSYWPSHYEDPAASLTANTCPELQTKIDALRQKAISDWPSSNEYNQLIQTLLQIGQEGTSVNRTVNSSPWSGVTVKYDAQ